MKKLLIVLVLFLTVCLAFVGCTPNKETPQPNDEPNESSKPSDTTTINPPSDYSISFFAFQGRTYKAWAETFYDNIPDELTVLVWYSNEDNSRQVITDKKVIADVFLSMSEINIEDTNFSSTTGPTITYNFAYDNGDYYAIQFDGKDKLLMSESSGMYITNTEDLFSISEITIIK